MLSDAKVKSLKIEDGKRHADRDGLVKKQAEHSFITI